MKTACLKRARSVVDCRAYSSLNETKVTLFNGLFLPEGDEHDQFDAEELSHGPDGSQLFSEGSVQQHQAVHGELEREERGLKTHSASRCGVRTFCTRRVFTSWDMLLMMTR